MRQKQKNENSNNFPYLPIDFFFPFPDPNETQDGVVCMDGNLSPGMLLSAYLQGIFPWYNADEPILWWSPDPRFTILKKDFHIPKRLKRFIKQNKEKQSQKDPTAFYYTVNTDFEAVITNCAHVKRVDQKHTWIIDEVIQAYTEFHRLGYAHSFETWQDGKLVGGFYGVLIGKIFFGESMFTLKPEASKAIFAEFAQIFFDLGGEVIDSQIYTDHIARFGGKNISRSAFLRLEKDLLFTKPKSSVIEHFQNHFS
ncbi:MAG TPA: leucyl/phenylalanyl-tRNA--protein transferase [Treponemataceae bacterium]|jgi:leucyl/phenylalanyl-tRNA--protein transferase|nr:leucyl/phenylalanyl-tRNA--protein transferase [Treponemataceae bacterium]